MGELARESASTSTWLVLLQYDALGPPGVDSGMYRYCIPFRFDAATAEEAVERLAGFPLRVGCERRSTIVLPADGWTEVPWDG